MTARKSPRSVKAWAGFVDGVMDSWTACDEYDGPGEVFRQYAIYGTYRSARRRYADVRRVSIVPLPSKKRKRHGK